MTAEHYGPFSALDLEERKDAVVRQYAKVFGSDLFLSPVSYVDRGWEGEEYSRGCFPVFGPGVLTGCGGEEGLRGAVGRAHFAGTELGRVCVGHMEGALEAGERAAREVVERVSGQIGAVG